MRPARHVRITTKQESPPIPKTIDEYLAGVPPKFRKTLERLRKYHDLLHEPEEQTVVGAISDWLRKRS